MQNSAATDYRVYVLDQFGHFTGAHVVYASNDDQAVELAADIKHSHGVEVWQRARRVAVLGKEAA